MFFCSVVEAARAYPGGAEIWVADDGSSDGSVPWLRSRYPDAKILELKTNRGYGEACNAGVRQARHGIVFLVNNDMELTPATLGEAVKWFEDPTVFGVRLGIQMQITREKPIDMGAFTLGLRVRRGMLELPMLRVPEPRKNWDCAALSGGACALRRELFLEWGGYDSLFSPAYWEDVDLSLRAWRRGCRVVFEPKAVCFHQGTGTMRRIYSEEKLRGFSERNRYFLAWKHGEGVGFWARHIFWTAGKLLAVILRRDWIAFKALAAALSRVGEVLRRRREIKRNARTTWREIFHKFGQETKFFPLFFSSGR